MNPHFLVTRVVLTSAALASIALAACSENAGEPTFDPDGGDGLAREMLPKASSLPGSGWEFSTVDDDDDDDGADDDLCQELEGLFADFDQESAEPAGSAAGEYVLESEKRRHPLPVSVELEVEIYDDAEHVKKTVSAFDEIVNSDEFEDCMREAFQQGIAERMAEDGLAPEAVQVTVERAETMTGAPRNGAEVGLDADMTILGIHLEMSMEMYLWRIGNALEFVFVSGAKDDITDEFVTTILDRIDGAAVIAAQSQ